MIYKSFNQSKNHENLLFIEISLNKTKNFMYNVENYYNLKNVHCLSIEQAEPILKSSNKIHLISKLSEFFSLEKTPNLSKNTATTKLSAVKPNRHTLAIFTPNTQATPTNTAQNGCVSSFVGLIVQNTIALVVNMHSRLITVVETQRPIFGAYSLTKLSGANMQNFLVGILAKLSHFTALESLVIGFILGLPMACLVIGFLSVMGV